MPSSRPTVDAHWFRTPSAWPASMTCARRMAAEILFFMQVYEIKFVTRDGISQSRLGWKLPFVGIGICPFAR